jgi:outer membrane protein OmpA-like peptidoglycan-associated protein
LKDKTIQGYTVLRSNNEKIPNVKVNINNGINSKKLTIYSDENGYYQFAFNTDSILLVEGSNENLYGIQEFNIDSNYILKKNHNLLLDSVMKEFKGKVINEKSNQVQSSALVYLINMDGIKIDSSFTDSTGHFFFTLKIAKDYEIHAFKGKADGVANIHTSILYKNEKDIDVFITEDYTPSLGKVVDSDTEEPLSFVKITIVDSTTNSKDISYTNDQGKFELHLHENNIYYLIIEKRNYFTKTLILNIGDSLPKTIDLNKDYNLKLSKSGFLIEPIYFDFKSHKLTKKSRAELDLLANYLKKNKSKTISIFGYTDCLGTEEYLAKKFNVVLGKNRATATRRYLESKGIARSRVNVIGRGAVNFVNSCFKPENCTDLEHRENRRCEFQLNDI